MLVHAGKIVESKVTKQGIYYSRLKMNENDRQHSMQNEYFNKIVKRRICLKLNS